MNPPDDSERSKSSQQDGKKARLAEKLRANLQRRKAQARSRREGAADQRPEGLMRGQGDDEAGDD